jgi:Spy/CpxP family protein refolding chaperone
MKRFTGIAFVGIAVVVALAVLASPAHAQGRRGMAAADVAGDGRPFGPPPFLKQLFSPRLVMEHQADIGLRPEQADAIKKAMSEAQQSLLPLQWKLEAESEALTKLLGDDHVDEAKVLAKLDEVTAIERDVKKVNFTLLVRVKNQLDPEQQVKIRKYRPFGMLRGERRPRPAASPE